MMPLKYQIMAGSFYTDLQITQLKIEDMVLQFNEMVSFSTKRQVVSSVNYKKEKKAQQQWQQQHQLTPK